MPRAANRTKPTVERATKRTYSDGITVDYRPMTTEEALQILEDTARGDGDKIRADAARKWLEINGGIDDKKDCVLEIIHTYKDKPRLIIPKIEIPQITPKVEVGAGI